MNIVLMLGLGITGFLLIFMFFKLGDPERKHEHIFLQLILLGFILSVFVLIGKASLDTDDYAYCSWNLNNYTSSGGNVTDMNYAFECPSTTPNTATTFYKLSLWIMRITITYLVIYYIFQLMNYFGIIKKPKE